MPGLHRETLSRKENGRKKRKRSGKGRGSEKNGKGIA
jgi:hypothetical protein